MGEAEREQLFWALKAQTTALRGQAHLDAQTPPVRFGPNRDQPAQPRPVRRARVLSTEDRRARLAQEGQPAAPPPPAQPASPPLQTPAAPHVASQHADPPPASQHADPAPPPSQPGQSSDMEWSAAQSAAPFVPSAASYPAASTDQPQASNPAQSGNMEWSPLSSPQPILSQPSLQNAQSPLFPPRPGVFCIPASPVPLIPSRPCFFSLPARPPPFPIRTSRFCLNQPPPIPHRPFIFPVRPPGFPPRPYFLSGQCITICPPAIPERLFFMSGQCVSKPITL